MKELCITTLLMCFALTIPSVNAAGTRAPSCGFKELYIIQPGKMNQEEEVLASTLQGHMAHSKQQRIWIAVGGISQILLDEMKKEGVQLHEAESVWDLVKQFRPNIKGAIIYKKGTSKQTAPRWLSKLPGS